MTQPKHKKDDPIEDAPHEKDQPVGLPAESDPDNPHPEDLESPVNENSEKVLEQMAHADGSDQGAHQSNAKQPVGLNEEGRQTTSSSDVE